MSNQWIQVAPGTYVSPYGPQDMLNAIWIAPTNGYQPNVWHTKSLLVSPSNLNGLPQGARAIALSGLVIHTNPTTVGTYASTLALRPVGSTWESNYGIQGCSVNFLAWHSTIGNMTVAPSNGLRQPAFSIVALNSECEFQFKYTISCPSGGIPMVPGNNFQLNFAVPMWWGEPDLFPYPGQ